MSCAPIRWYPGDPVTPSWLALMCVVTPTRIASSFVEILGAWLALRPSDGAEVIDRAHGNPCVSARMYASGAVRPTFEVQVAIVQAIRQACLAMAEQEAGEQSALQSGAVSL